jgi:hypothetical protein
VAKVVVVKTKKKTTVIPKKKTTVAELEKRVIELENMCKCKPEVTEGASLEKRVFAIEKYIIAITKK